MNGYKVLFDKKILHQDIKPENILIRKNIFKLADFGLSIFYEGYDFGDSREGTLSYIAP
jgi:serine/threonine-protein kinase ULK/ATG1